MEIRARVTGFLEDVLFQEGEVVNEGKVLYRIEPDTFQAAVQQAQGALLEAQAKLANATVSAGARRSWSRPILLRARCWTNAWQTRRSAQGGVVIADANLKTANVNLGYTEITAPITGEVGRSKLTKGMWSDRTAAR